MKILIVILKVIVSIIATLLFLAVTYGFAQLLISCPFIIPGIIILAFFIGMVAAFYKAIFG